MLICKSAKIFRLCAICGVASNERRIVMDHDHRTGLIRGNLCDTCNTRLGVFESRKEFKLKHKSRQRRWELAYAERIELYLKANTGKRYADRSASPTD